MKFSQCGGSLKGKGKGVLAARETPKPPFRSLSNACHAGYVKYAFSRRSSAVTGKKCTKKSVLRVQSCWFAYCKCFIKPGGLVYFISFWGGWGLIETGGLFEREGLFNLEKTVVSVLHKELECKVEKLKYRKLDVMQPRIKNKSNLPLGK